MMSLLIEQFNKSVKSGGKKKTGQSSADNRYIGEGMLRGWDLSEVEEEECWEPEEEDSSSVAMNGVLIFKMSGTKIQGLDLEVKGWDEVEVSERARTKI